MSARLPLWDALRGQEGSSRVAQNQVGGSRLSSAAGQAARDQARLDAARDTVASEVIEFQVVRQRARLAAAEPGGEPVVAPLSPRELEVLQLVAAGRTDGEIADELFISKKTASVHVANIKGKLGAASRIEIVLVARRLGLVDGAADGAAIPAPDAQPARPGVICPFKGLASYERADAAYFFGRERAVAELVARLASSTFVAVTGSSGSGKSSVLAAGLVPSLRAGVLPGSDGWRAVILRPGEHPATELARAIASELETSPAREPGDPLDRLDALAPGARLVVVVDQLEEAFTLCPDAAERASFFDAIAALAGDTRRRALVAVAIRGDFYGRCAEHPALATLVGGATVLLGPMAADELARAIELPARAAGLRLDPDLSPALVGDVLAQPGALPLLSATLLDLWQRRDGRALRTDAYRAIGGITGAVARVAEGAIDRLTPDEQVVARAILLRLSTTTDSGAVVRRRATLDELGASSPDVQRVLDVLTDQRLVSVDEGEVDLAHEALLRDWPRMRRWLDEDVEGRRIRERLARAVRDWQAADRDHSELYRGQRLAAASEWATGHGDELNDLERDYLAMSRAAADAHLERERRQNGRLRRFLAVAAAMLVVALVAGVVAVRQAQVAGDQAALAADRSRDADAARGDAEAARADAEAARADAEAAADFATSRALVASSAAALTSDPTLARLLAVAAADRGPIDLELEAALHAAWQADPVVRRLTVAIDGADGYFADVDPAGSRVAVFAYLDEGPPDARRAVREALQVIDVASGEVAWSYAPAMPGVHMDGPWFSADGSTVLVSTYWAPEEAEAASPPDDLGILRLDAATGEEVDVLDDGPCGAIVVGVSDSWLLTARARDGAEPGCYGSQADPGSGFGLLDPVTGVRRWLAEETLNEAVISRDGRVAAFTAPGLRGVLDAQVVFVDVATGRERSRIPFDSIVQQDERLQALSADGSLALVGDRPIAVVDTATGEVLTTLGAAQGEHLGIAFAPDGDIAYTAGREGTLRAWDARKGSELFALPTAGGGRVSAAAHGTVAVTDFALGTITLSNPWLRGEVATARTCVGGLFPAGQLQVAAGIAVVGGDCGDQRPTYAFDTHDWTQIAAMPDSDGQAIALSPDGTRVVRQTMPADIVDPLHVDDVATGRPLLTLEGLCAWSTTFAVRAESEGCRPFPTQPFPMWALALAYSPDGSLIAGRDTGDEASPSYLAVWDAATGQLLAVPEVPSAVEGFLFTPDSSELLVGTESDGIVAYATDTWTVVRSGAAADIGPVSPRAHLADGSVLGTTRFGSLGDTWFHVVDAQTLAIRRSVRLADSLKSLAVSRDGTLLATGAADGRVRVWDAATFEELNRLAVPGQAQGLAFLDDGRLAVTPQQGGILVQTLDHADLLERVRSGLTRGFTPQECERFGLDPCPTLDQLVMGPETP